ncbi:MAG: GEVED domain-containing protein [Rikenellaceae bacterium]
MKKLFLKSMLFVSIMALAMSCGDNDEPDQPLPPDPEATIVDASINAATKSFVINGANIPVAFSIDAASEVLSDAVFTITTDGDIDHEVSQKTLTILKGQKTVAGEIIIKSTAKKEGSLRISIASTNADIKIVSKEVVINLTKEVINAPDGYCAVNVKYSAYSGLKAFSIGDKKEENIPFNDNKGWTDRTKEVVMLPIGASQVSLTYQQGRTTNGDPYALAAWIDLNGDADFTDAGECVLFEEFTANGEKTVTVKLNVPANAAKAGRIRFGTYFTKANTTITKENPCGMIDSGDLMDMTYNLVEGELLPDLSISSAETNIVVGETDKIQELTVSLSKALTKDLVVLLNMKGGFEGACELPKSVTISKGQTSAKTSIKFLASGFPAEVVKAVITLSVSPEDEMLANVGNNGSIIFNVNGSGNVVTATVAFEKETIQVGDADDVAKFTITLSEPATRNSLINIAFSGASDKYIGSLPSTITIPTGTTTGSGEIKLLVAGFTYAEIVKDIKVSISSDDVFIAANNYFDVVAVNGSTTGLKKPTIYIGKNTTTSPMFLEGNITSSFQVYIPKKAGNDVPAPDDITFKIRVEGAIEGVHYNLPVKQFTIKKGESRVNPINIEWIKDGYKEGENRTVDLFVDIVSGYAKDSGYSLQYAIIRPQPGVYCPVVVDAKDANEWGTLRSYSIGTLSKTTAATLAYEDRTSTPTTIKNGENTFNVVVGTDAGNGGDKYTVAMYIDWNGDGNFAGAGENYSTELFKIGADGESQTKTFTVTPPAGAVSSSRIRFGLMLNGWMENGCVSKFESHKIVDMTYQLAK